MKIIAKPDTALEQTVKAMCDKIKKSFDEANDMVEQMTGSRPVSPACIYHWGTIMRHSALLLSGKQMPDAA